SPLGGRPCAGSSGLRTWAWVIWPFPMTTRRLIANETLPIPRLRVAGRIELIAAMAASADRAMNVWVYRSIFARCSAEIGTPKIVELVGGAPASTGVVWL